MGGTGRQGGLHRYPALPHAATATLIWTIAALTIAFAGAARADYPLGYARGYVDAVNRSMGSGPPNYTPDPAGVVNDLTVITDTNAELIWQGGSPSAQGHVLMSMFTDYSGYTTSYTDSTHRHTVWATAAPELHDFLTDNQIPASQIAERTKQLLGMPSSHSGDRVVEVWVRRDNLRRPCRDPDVTNPVSSLVFPADVDTKYPGHRAEFLGNMSTYSTAGGNTPYPWTQLGYTYDWGNPDSNRGLTEFWVGGYDDTDAGTIAKTEITVYSVFSIGSYPYWDRATLDFNVTGDCDTIWAGTDYVPTSGGDTITVASGATVYQGILLSSAGYTVTNHGTVVGPGRNADRTFRAGVIRFDAAGTLVNDGTIDGQIGVVASAGDLAITNRAGGTISGWQQAVSTADGADQIHNSGTIAGHISTGAGDDQITLADGSVTGNVDGGADTDTLTFNPDSGATASLVGDVANVETITIGGTGQSRLDGSVDGSITVASGATLGGNMILSGSLTN